MRARRIDFAEEDSKAGGRLYKRWMCYETVQELNIHRSDAGVDVLVRREMEFRPVGVSEP
jgi:hypothetical protein